MVSNSPRFHDENVEKPSLYSFATSIDFTLPGKTVKEQFQEFRDVLIEQGLAIEQLYDLDWRFIIGFVGEIAKNVRDHGGGKGYVRIEAEEIPLSDKHMLHIAIGDFGEGMPVEEGFDYNEHFVGQEGIVRKAPWKGERKEGTFGAGGLVIKGWAERADMQLVMYNKGKSWLMHDSIKGYTWMPDNVSYDTGVHFFGSFFVEKQSDPTINDDIIETRASEKEQIQKEKEVKNTLIDMDFDLIKEEEKYREIVETYLPVIRTYLDGKNYMKQGGVYKGLPYILNELLKNIHSYGGGKGYLTLEEEISAEGQILLHFALGDFGPGIKSQIGSYDLYYKEGFTTDKNGGVGSRSGYGHGGAAIKERAIKSNLHVVLVDNGEEEIVNNIDDNYTWRPANRDLSKGAHFIGTIPIVERKTPQGDRSIVRKYDFEHRLDFRADMDNQKLKDMYTAFLVYLKTIIDPENRHGGNALFFDFANMINEIQKNIKDHGGRYGIIKAFIEDDTVIGGKVLRFVIGDNGEGILATAGSYEKYFEQGYTTGHPKENLGQGGAMLKDLSKKHNIHLTLIDNCNEVIIHNAGDAYYWMPIIDMSLGTYFIGTYLLEKKAE